MEVHRAIERSHWLLDIERRPPPAAVVQEFDPFVDRRHLLDRFCGRCPHVEGMHHGPGVGVELLGCAGDDCPCPGFVYGSRPRRPRWTR